LHSFIITNDILKALPYLHDILWVAFSIFFLSEILVTSSHKNVPTGKSSVWIVLVYALPMMAAWSIYLLAYWPGGMSLDSIHQWEQLLG